MKKFFAVIAALIGIGLVTLIGAGFWLSQEINRPNGITEDREILVVPGSSGYSIAQLLQDNQLISHPQVFYGLIRIKHATIKAGEYAIPAQSSMMNILDIFQANKTIQRNFTLTEGQTVKQAVLSLNENTYLAGDVTTTPDEGTLMPETYSFIRGETRDALIKRMQEAHTKMLDELWENRDDDLVISTKEQAVTLASIVEKETGKASERKRIAGLFYNRLKIGMPLQTDPTVVYVITDKLGHMQGKPLYSRNMQIDSPYNTYKVVGLPPGPIANPGRESLEAVMHPEHHDYLFFVADGTGGHVFSKNLSGHNKNVNEWRKIKKKLNTKAK